MTATTTEKEHYFPPCQDGGLQVVRGYSNQPGWGEPLNVIISAHSDPYVLTDEGFQDFCQSIGFSYEFMHLHGGPPMTANLADGHDWKDQAVELRQDYGRRHVGTGLQTLIGGNHLRMWRQNGPKANTGALFLAVSITENLHQHHKTAADGYNRGRDALVADALKGGRKSPHGHHYTTTAEEITGLFVNNDYQFDHNIAQDDKVILLTVKIEPKTEEHGLLHSAKAAMHSMLS